MLTRENQRTLNASLGHGFELIVDRGDVIAATQAATERRRRLQSEQLKRFHQQSCVRVNERVLQQREHQQSRDKRIDAKLARLLQLPTSATAQTAITAPTATTRVAVGSLRLSSAAHADALLNAKRNQLQSAGATLSLVERALRSDAQAREMLLVATRVARTRECRNCVASTLDESDDDDEHDNNQAGEGRGRARSGRDDVTLPVKQRAELYAAVRRRYMAIERERAQQRGADAARDTTSGGVVHGSSKSKTIHNNRNNSSNQRGASDEHRSNPLLKIVDASIGCELKLQRQAARASSTPWRNSPSQPPSTKPSSSSLSSAKRQHLSASPTTHERFLTALQAELGTPALCSCGSRAGRSECANNCAFYRQPKRKERVAAAVCKQHEAAA